MNLRGLIGRARRVLEQRAVDGRPVIRFVLPDNGKGPAGLTTGRGGKVDVHLWSAATGTCSFDGCAERHDLDADGNPRSAPEDAGADDIPTGPEECGDDIAGVDAESHGER